MMTTPQVVAPLAVTLFGPMQVSVGGQPLAHLRSRKSLWLLALLALRQGQPVEREWLAETLWPDAGTDQSLTSLRTVLCELRRALGREGRRVQSPNRHSLCLELGGMFIDLLEFDAAKSSREAAVLKQAVALYQGPLLEGCTEEWVTQERLAREQDCLRVLRTLADAARADGDFETATGYFRHAVGLNPWRESAQRGLMQALSESGDSNAALNVYHVLTRLLQKDNPRASPDQKTTALYSFLRAEARRRASLPHRLAAEPPTAPETDSAPAVTGYVPHALTDLIGRAEECVSVMARLRRFRLVTLTGPGGIGKTRLALSVAAEAASEYADGVWLVSLDSLAEGRQVERQILLALGLKEEPERSAAQTLTDYLRQKRLLLVLDNCEHLLEASAEIAGQLLGGCADVRILATSREALGMTGEAAWAVPGLAKCESVQLFVERAQAVNRGFALTENNAPAVAQVCARLEGIPLAIELAAARVRVLTAEQVAARLDDYLSLLTGGSRAALPRQQTLRATLDWSYDLLSLPSRLLLARLSVFAGGWTLEAAEQVGAGGEIAAVQVLDLLTGLVDKSLVAAVPSGTETRYRFLEIVRQYAEERLAKSGESAAVRDKHLSWCVALAEDTEAKIKGPEQAAVLARLEMEHDNLRASLAWKEQAARGSKGDYSIGGLRLAASLWRFWSVRGHLSEGRRWLEQALVDAASSGDTSAVRVKALTGAGNLARMQGDYRGARALYEQSLTMQQQLGDRQGIANSLNGLGIVAECQGDYARARALQEESLSIKRQLEDKQGVASTLNNLGIVATCQSDYAGARLLYEESLSIKRQLGSQHGVAQTLGNLGVVAECQGDYAEARALQEESLSIERQLGYQQGIAAALNNLGIVACAQGDYAAAQSLHEESLAIMQHLGNQRGIAECLGAMGGVALGQRLPERAALLGAVGAALCESISSRLCSFEQEKLDKTRAAARAVLGEEAFAAAWDAGWEMPLDEAVRYALKKV